MHLVIILESRHVFNSKAGTDLYAFYSTDAKHSAQFSVEFIENRLAETGRTTSYDYFDHAAG
jgi:hypothetical protein